MLSFLKRPAADVTLNVKGEPFHPGDIVNLGISISSQDSFTLRSASAELDCIEVYWRLVSDGKTTSNQKTERNLFRFKEEFLGYTEFTSGMAVNGSASFVLPKDIPPSVSGKIANISWRLDVKLNVAKMRDIHKKSVISVLPAAVGIPVTGGSSGYPESQVTASSDDGSLLITIDSECGSAGKILHGSLEAAPRKDLSFTEIRAELEMKESAGNKSLKTVADTVVLEEKSTLPEGTHERWSFELKFPDSAAPSVDVSSTKVEWNVKGIVARRLKTDVSVSYSIRVS